MKYLTFLCCVSMLLFAATDEKNFKLEHLELAQSEDGTPLPADFEFRSGDTIFFSAHVSGFTRNGDDPPKYFLNYAIEVRDPHGTLILPVETGKMAGDLSPEDREWRPKFRFTIALPALADSGAYQLVAKAKDEFGHVEAQGTVPIRVVGREVAPSDKLAVRNFRFLRTEEDRDLLHDPAYRTGDTVWARFDMTGYKLGDKNRFEIEYGIKVLRANGELTYEQPHAADAANDSFYPQRYTPGILSLNLPKDLKTGVYTIVLTIRDRLGNQIFDTQQRFTVE